MCIFIFCRVYSIFLCVSACIIIFGSRARVPAPSCCRKCVYRNPVVSVRAQRSIASIRHQETQRTLHGVCCAFFA